MESTSSWSRLVRRERERKREKGKESEEREAREEGEKKRIFCRGAFHVTILQIIENFSKVLSAENEGV